MKAIINKVMIFVIVVGGALTFFFKASSLAWTSDDCIYSFILNKKSLSKAVTGRKVQTVSDAIHSQYNQFCAGNGRSIVHFFTQMFDGIWGQMAFSVFIAILFVLVMFSFIQLTQHELNRRNGIAWFLLSVGVLYLFPDAAGLWYAPAYSLNYFLTMFTSIIFLLLYRKVIENENMRKEEITLIAFFSFIAGWMNEAYTIPISGALFLWLIITRKKITTNRLIVAIAFWLGTIILILGSLKRAGRVSSHIGMALNALELYDRIKIIWITLIACVVLILRSKLEFKVFVKKNLFYFLMLAVAVLLSFIANTEPRSLMGVEFSSFIILFKLIDKYLLRLRYQQFILNICAVCIVLIGIHQVFIIKDFKRVHDVTLEVIGEARGTSDGLAKIPNMNISALTRPYVSNWMSDSVFVVWYDLCISAYYMEGKTFAHLRENDYNALKHPEKFFVKKNRMPGNAPVYRGDDYYWMRNCDIPADRKMLCRYHRVRFQDAVSFPLGVKFALFPEKYPTEEVITLPDTVEIKNDKGVFMFRRGKMLRAKSFSYVEQNRISLIQEQPSKALKE